MSIASAVARGRVAAESAFTLTLTAYAPSGRTTDADGYEVPVFTSQGTTRGKVQAQSRQGDTVTRHVTVGGVSRPVLTAGLHIPISAPLPVASEQRGKGWEYEVTAVGDLADVALLGRRFLVVDVPMKSYASARRLDVVEVS